MSDGPEVLEPLGLNKSEIYAKCMEVDGDVVFSIKQTSGTVEIVLNQAQLSDLYSATARAMHWSRIRRERRQKAEWKKRQEKQQKLIVQTGERQLILLSRRAIME
jgi:hypothetical protein